MKNDLRDRAHRVLRGRGYVERPHDAGWDALEAYEMWRLLVGDMEEMPRE